MSSSARRFYKKRSIAGMTHSVHRLVWMKAHGPIPDGYVTHHRNGDPLDNRLENLELLTHQVHSQHHNGKHPIERECVACGEMFEPPVNHRGRAVTCSRECWLALMSTKRNNAKLSLTDYAEIRRRIAAGEKQKDIAADYDVSPASITRIKQMGS